MKLFWTTLLIGWFAALAGVHTETFTTIDDLKRLLSTEQDVARLLRSYVRKQQGHLVNLAR